MKKATFSTTVLVLLGALLLLPFFAAAAPGITEPSVKFTADYSKFADEDDDFIVVTTESFTVNNSEGMNKVTVKATGLPSKYNSQSTTVDPGETKPVTLTIEVPHDKAPGSEKIGKIVITDGNQELDSADLVQETVSMLDLSELEVKYVDSSGKTQKDEFNTDNKKYQLENEVKPYTDITFTFDLQNLFDRDYQNQGKLEEVEVTVDVDDDDLLEDGFKASYNFEDIEAGKAGKYSLTLLTNEKVEPGTYSLEFTITAEDGEGIEYEIKKEVEVEIELDDEDLRIIKAQLAPETATLCDKEVSLQVSVHNFGSDDQDSVKVTLDNEELNLHEKIEDMVIDAHTEDDDRWQKTFAITLENVKEKIYFLDLKVHLDNTLTDAEVVQLELKPCATPEVTEEEEEEVTPLAAESAEEEKVTAEETTTAKQADLTGNIIKSVEKPSYTADDYLVALMLITIALLSAMMVLMLIIIFKK